MPVFLEKLVLLQHSMLRLLMSSCEMSEMRALLLASQMRFVLISHTGRRRQESSLGKKARNNQITLTLVRCALLGKEDPLLTPLDLLT